MLGSKTFHRLEIALPECSMNKMLFRNPVIMNDWKSWKFLGRNVWEENVNSKLQPEVLYVLIINRRAACWIWGKVSSWGCWVSVYISLLIVSPSQTQKTKIFYGHHLLSAISVESCPSQPTNVHFQRSAIFVSVIKSCAVIIRKLKASFVSFCKETY